MNCATGSRWLAALALGAPLLLAGPSAEAQEGGRLSAPLPQVGGMGDAAARTRQLLGSEAGPEGYLLRSTSSLAPRLEEPAGGDGFAWSLVSPRLDLAWNSRIPLSMNDGSMWAGRGATVRVLAGARVEAGPVFLVLAPQFTRTANAEFDLVLSTDPERSRFSPPWRSGPFSADLPVRFGDAGFTQLDLGQSALGVRAGPVEVGLTTEDEWWGPGVRNAILLSNNAQGIPRLFLRTGRPLATPIGDVSARWLTGVLSESLYFDRLARNDYRAFSGLAATLSLARVPGLTIGVGRTVVEAMTGADDIPGRVFTVLRWDQPDEAEEIASLFGRWIFPRSGVEVYGEWAHFGLPSSFTDLAGRPQRSLGYTLGMQWAKPLDADSAYLVRLRSEVTTLERRHRPGGEDDMGDFSYTSADVVQGYTQRGQVIGAAIGPGASGQWVAADFVGRGGMAGLGLARVRWDNDVFYTTPNGRSFLAHDVSVLADVHAGMRVGPVELEGALIHESRLNFLFQNPSVAFDARDAVDVRNLSLRLTLTAVP